METKVVIISDELPRTCDTIPGDLLRNLHEFKLQSCSKHWDQKTNESIFKGSFFRFHYKFTIRTNSSDLVEQIRILFDANERL